MFNRKLLKNLDWPFLASIAALLALSLYIMGSASLNIIADDPQYFLKKQATWMFLGLIAMTAMMLFNYKDLEKFSKVIYGVMIATLIGVLFFEQEGVSRWYNLGFFDYQPSETAKIATIICLAAYLSAKQDKIQEWSTFWGACLLVGVPMILVFIEPDLGTSLVFCAIIYAMMWMAGIPKKRMLGVLAIAVAAVAFVFVDLYFATGGFTYLATDLPIPLPMKAYQLNRLIIFVNPEMDPLDTGYHIIQSKVAIGSGGFFGEGYGVGSQVQSDFLPAHHTDFIFSVVGEELGFIGAVFLLGVYLFMLMRAVKIAVEASDMFGTLIVTGIVTMIVFQIFVNVGMTIGIMPITGLPLPLFSYGGTGMLVNLLCIGIILSINLRKQTQLF